MARVLAIAAHPDDETIGAGGTLARHALAGDELYWCIATRAYTPEWTQEAIDAASRQVDRAAGVYGFREVFRLDFPTVKLNTIPTIALATALQRVIDRVRPEVVYMPAADDVNEDHRIMHHAGLVAVRPLPGSSVRRVLAYEIVTTARFGLHGFTPTVFVDITETLAKKLEAMACYETELRSLPHPRSLEALELFARERGVSVGMGAAEHFQLVREML